MVLGTFVSSSCDIKINVNIVENCCRNLAVRGLSNVCQTIKFCSCLMALLYGALLLLLLCISMYMYIVHKYPTCAL